MPKLVLIRHGQSQWNLENRFTGWWDADLTEKGENEARDAGTLLSLLDDQNFCQAFTSVQTRAIRTLWLVLRSMNRVWMPTTKHWRLNERHYGALTGLDKARTKEKYGEEQVQIWRRSYDIPPPKLQSDGPYDLSNDPRYKDIQVPQSESLELTSERVVPYWDSAISPVLRSNTDTIIVAHGNSLRALVKHLFEVDNDEIVKTEIPTGNPMLIEIDSNLRPQSAKYLDAKRATDIPALKA